MKYFWILFACISFLGISTTSYSQDNVVETYYKDQYATKELPSKKRAKYILKEWMEGDVQTLELINIKSGNLVFHKEYKLNEPTGIWKYYDKKGNLENTEYNNFTVKYTDHPVESEYYIKFEDDKFVPENEDVAFTPPQFIYENNFLYCLYSGLRYPAYARENGIQGVVRCNVKISKTGEFEILSILDDGVHPSLVKASYRGLMNCGTWKPAMKDGEPIDSYWIIPVKFKLEG